MNNCERCRQKNTAQAHLNATAKEVVKWSDDYEADSHEAYVAWRRFEIAVKQWVRLNG